MKDTINICGFDYSIRFVPSITTGPKWSGGADDELIGFIRASEHDIQILNSLSMPATMRTIAHEIAHASIWNGLLLDPARAKDEEELVCAMASYGYTVHEAFTRLGGTRGIARRLAGAR